MKRNFLFAGLSNFFKLFSGIVLFFVFARVFSPSEFGELTYAFVVAVLVGLIVDYGYIVYLPKECSVNPKSTKKLVSNAFFTKLFLSFIALSIVSIAIILEMLVGDIQLIYMFCISSILVALANSFLVPFRSINRFQTETKALFIQHTLLSTLALIFVYLEYSIYWVALSYFVARLFFLLFGYTQFVREFGHIKFNPFNIFSELKRISPFAVHAIAATAMVQVDTLILRQFVEPSEIGLYQAGMRFVMAASVVITIFYDVLIPRFSSAYSGCQTALKDMVHKFNWIVIALAFVGCFVFYFASDMIVWLAYGEQWLHLTEYVGLFAIFIFLRFFGITYNALLTSSGLQKKRAKYLILTFCVVVVLDCILIPIYYIEGALLALIFGHVFLYVLTMRTVFKQFGTLFIVKSWL